MRTLIVSILVAAGLLGPLAAAPRQTVPRDAEAFETHVRAVRAEREARFLAAWRDADDELRDETSKLVHERRRPGAPAGAPMGLDVLEEATRHLRGMDSEPTPLRRAADALDLMIVPGHQVLDAGAGPPEKVHLTVRVHPLYAIHLEQPVDLSLYWRSESGEEWRARRERVEPTAFRRPGFDMFVTAPEGGGAWELLPELGVASGTGARGAPVRFEAHGREDVEGVPSDAFGAALRELEQHGLRSAAARFGHEHELGDRAPAAIAGEPLVWAADVVGETRARVVLVLLPPQASDALASFSPEKLWRSAARRSGAHLVAANLDARPDQVLQRVRQRYPGLPLVLVAWGDAVTRLAFLRLTNPGLAPDGWVLLESLPGTFPAVDVPVLRLAVEDDRPQLVHLRELPGRVEEWCRVQWPPGSD